MEDESEPHSPPDTTARHYDWTDSNDPSTAIVEAVADAVGRRVEEMPVLYDAVNPDAVDALVAPTIPASTPVDVSFEYGGALVTVANTGTITVRPLTAGD